MQEDKCPICKNSKSVTHKYCSYRCRNIQINKNKNYKKQSNSVSEGLKKYWKGIKGEKKRYDVICHKCTTCFFVEEYENEFPIKDKYFCNRSCANSRGKRTKEVKEKIKKSLRSETKYDTCNICNKKWYNSRNSKTCSRSCANESIRIKREKKLTEKESYRKLTNFKFNLSDYPDEFDFSLVEQYGWYKAKNRGDNLWQTKKQ